MYSNIMSDYASIIFIVAVAVFIIVSNHAWQAIFMVCVGSASQVPYKNIYTVIVCKMCKVLNWFSVKYTYLPCTGHYQDSISTDFLVTYASLQNAY